jgi:hypothetical protein
MRCRWRQSFGGSKNDMAASSKIQSHSQICKAAVLAKCWMHGIRAHINVAKRAELTIASSNPKTTKVVQVKGGYSPVKGMVYLTQCKGEDDLIGDKFDADFVVFVNIETKVGKSHQHDGSLGFEHLQFFVLPRANANAIYRASVQRELAKPLKSGGVRSLKNLAVVASNEDMHPFLNGWQIMQTTHHSTPPKNHPLTLQEK